MINMVQISIIFFLHYIYLVSCVPPTTSTMDVTENENIDDLNAKRNACIVDSDINPYALPPREYERLIKNSDHSLGCFMACAMKADGTMNEDGTISDESLAERAKQGATKAELEPFINCKEEKGADDCETAMKVIQCTYAQG